MRRRISLAAAAVVAVVALGVGVVDRTDTRTETDRILDVANTIRCPACRGQAAGSSDSAAAQAIRQEIAERIADGQSDDDIRQYFAATQGEEILLTPPRSGIGALVWIIPVVVLAAGGAGLFVAFRRWRSWE